MKTIVAHMYDDKMGRVYEVASDSGRLFSRERGKRKWSEVHSTLNPTLDAYLARCHGNFGWRVEKV